eukprot:724224-Amphidinium_carterae.1
MHRRHSEHKARLILPGFVGKINFVLRISPALQHQPRTLRDVEQVALRVVELADDVVLDVDVLLGKVKKMRRVRAGAGRSCCCSGAQSRDGSCGAVEEEVEEVVLVALLLEVEGVVPEVEVAFVALLLVELPVVVEDELEVVLVGADVVEVVE